jgi:hypothetical protein
VPQDTMEQELKELSIITGAILTPNWHQVWI